MASSTAVDLENVPSVDNTMIDFFRRLKCQSKLDKRLILIGIHFFFNGELVTDDLVVGIIDEAMKRPSCQKGSFLMDYLELWFKQKSKLKITSDSESEIPLSDDKYSGS
ncbi:hypothetical protein IFM89_021762 [Coptis chinensis]|uniref:Uncharacterized protein n=1 Tax=Coptis chinensis TaxID=261450 RepID=A0A835H858_9MAGN|nr:hypothetical protein IFM89_021762 [Coptis chinensis]